MRVSKCKLFSLFFVAVICTVLILGFTSGIPAFAGDTEPLESKHEEVINDLSFFKASNVEQVEPAGIDLERKVNKAGNFMKSSEVEYLIFEETEPNNTIYEANLVNDNYYGQVYYYIVGTITDNSFDLDYFRFDVTQSGTFDMIGFWFGDYFMQGLEDDLVIALVDENDDVIKWSQEINPGPDGFQLLVCHVDPGTYYILVFQISDSGYKYIGEEYLIIVEFYADDDSCVVSTPQRPTGPADGTTNTSYTYSTGGSSCSAGHNVEYRFDWGDGTYSNWSISTDANKTWNAQGTYQVKSQARCAQNQAVLSSWSQAKTVSINGEMPENSIQVFIEPQAAINAGAKWRLNNSKTNTGVNSESGIRPPRDLASIPSDAMENDLLRIKFKPDMTPDLDQMRVTSSDQGIALAGIDEVDSLNIKYKASAFKSMLDPLYEISEVSNQYRERHRKHGLHLWYEIEIDGRSDFKKAVADYNNLEMIDKAEPLFKKRPANLELLEDEQEDSIKTGDDKKVLQSSWIPNDPRFNRQWHYHNTGQHGGTAGADIDLINAWGIEKGNSDVIVAIVDEGIQYDHPDLSANMWPGIGPDGFDTIPGDHATHVAGTVAAVSNNNIGVAGVAGGSGIGDGVRLMSIDAFEGAYSDNDILLYAYQADNGVAISQNSWGFEGEFFWPDITKDAIDYFNAEGGGDVLDGGLTITSAGNKDDSGYWYPGRYDGVMAVAATNNRDIKADYSNYGFWIEISAPGGETYPLEKGGVYSTYANSGYGYKEGTSMASPQVAGVAALMISLAPGEFTANEIREMLKETADDHYGKNPSYIGQLGSGRLNAHQALLRVQSELSVPDTWKDSGEIISDLTPGSYTVTFKEVAGWIKPKDISVNVAAGQIVTETGTYQSTAQPLAPPSLTSPVHGEIVDGFSIELNWAPAAGATHYTVWVYNLTKNEEVIFSAPMSETSYTLDGLADNGDNYAWSVVGLNANDNTAGEFATPIAFINGSDADLLPPTLASPAHSANVSGTSAEFSWEVSDGATLYSVWLFNLTTNEQVIQTVPSSETSYTFTGLANNGDLYAWSVIASDSYDWSDYAFPRLFVNE